MEIDERYMRRALELAQHGEGNTSPNPMVGAVIVDPNGRIIGEGYHRKCGEGHAEVNAIASVKPADRNLLKSSTIYVTLEPCSHFGKTPPCAKLIIDTGIPKVVIGAGDPFKEVSGRGIKMLRDAGVEVVDGILSYESRRLNKKFMTAHENRRPYITLKWAQSSDGFMDWDRPNGKPYRFSNNLNSMLVHRLRSHHDAIMVGSTTAINDNPCLNCRLWPGRSPQPIVLDRRKRIDLSSLKMENPLILSECKDISSVMIHLYSNGYTSVIVEGGAKLLKSIIETDLWDEARIEINPDVLGEHGRIEAPVIAQSPISTIRIGKNTVKHYEK